MKRTLVLALICSAFLLHHPALAQGRGEPGKSIGTVTVRGDLILLTLNEGALGKASLFDLNHRTLQFTPDGVQYRVGSIPFQWDADFGPEMTGSEAALKNFAFPFSGKTWNAFGVGMTGSMTFGEPAAGRGRGGAGGGGGAAGRGAAGAGGAAGRGAAGAAGAGGAAGFGGGRGGGISVDRFAELAQAGRSIINTVPAISVFFKPRMNGKRYMKEMQDRAVITWSLTEPVGGVQDMLWTPSVNRFQAVLQKDGTIVLSYDAVAAQDAIIGVYPMANAGVEKEIGAVNGAGDASVPPNLDVKSVKLASVDGLFLKAVIETRGPVPAEAGQTTGVSYRICLNKKPGVECTQDAKADAMWTIGTGGGGGRGGNAGGGSRYNAFGTGALNNVKVDGNTLSVEGTLPQGYKPGDQVYVSAAAASGSAIHPQAVKLTAIASPEVDLSAAEKQDGPYSVVYEAFHYLKPPRGMDLTCSVIKALGDKFDFLAYYSDFRIDNPEAGTSSSGPRGGGPEGGAVTGLGGSGSQRNLASYCTQGRFQWQYIQPVWVGANQMQEYPPEGLNETNVHNVAAYTHELSERTFNGKIPPYDYAMSQIGHEMGHRWSAFASAKVGNETIQLGPTHYQRGLQAPAAFPYQRPVEASAMGGGVWQDNFDGTYTQLDDDYYVPATGWSYLDLYLMGLIGPSEVPDFFILRNLVPSGRDANGRPIFKADRTKITVKDVIAAEGPRTPDVDHSQKKFNTGMVMVVEHGKTPSKELIERTSGIRLRWMDYWETTTGHRSTMTANPK